MALTGLAIAAALALAKDQMVDQPAAKRKRKLAAETQRLSPWTGLKADAPDDPNTLGTVMQYGAAGAQMGANIHASNATANLDNAAAGTLNSASAAAPVGENALGGQDMAGKLGAQSQAFQASQAAPAAGAAEKPGWFFGSGPRQDQPVGALKGADPSTGSNAYATLYDNGVNPDAQQFYKTSRYAY